jgi:hypothetical protein
MKHCLVAATLLGLSLFSGTAAAQYAVEEETSDGRWNQTFRLYGMGAAIDGEAQVGPVTVPVALSISDMFDALRLGGMAAYRLDNGDWSFSADATYMELAWRADTRGGRAGARLAVDQTTVMVTAGKRIGPNTELLGSLVYFDVGSELRLSGIQRSISASGSTSWVDPLVGLQHTIPFGDDWSLSLRGDVGGFGANSSFTWQAWVVAQRQVSERFGWFFGYRALGYDYETGSGVRFQRYNLTQQGPGLGVSFSF